MIGVYIIRHVETGRCYVGSSQNVKKRLREHRYKLERGDHPNTPLRHAWRAHGPTAFEFKPLVVCAVGDLIFYEQLIIDGYRAAVKPFGYNVRKVAESNAGIPTSAAQRSAMSAMMADPERSRNVRAKAREIASRPEIKEMGRRSLLAIRANPELNAMRLANLRASTAKRCRGVPLTSECKAKLSAGAYKRFKNGNPHTAKITAEVALMIFKDERPNIPVAVEFGVSRDMVNDIRTGRSWRHVTGLPAAPRRKGGRSP